MSFFGNIFGSANSESAPNAMWKPLTSEQELADAVNQSFNKKVVIFKHSTMCFVSKTVLRNFEREIEESSPDAVFYYLDLLKYRSISNKIEDDFGVTHQSPQLIVLQNGRALNHASHNSISIDMI